ncbi:hypothetical protein C8J57DRAFT_1174431 [Mycena rebaudengoi]|nr:hypothetical protein C8J57DRAFT_1174431 [Mycena rebaudengoi]
MTGLNPDALLSDNHTTRSRNDGSGRSTRSDIRKSISDLDARILALEQALVTARLERQDLQTRLNAYKYPILTLPTEITSEIFIHFLPRYPERPQVIGLSSPHILGQICRTWREIALGTPRLWRAIELNPPTARPTKALAILRTWISRSKNCPLSISLQCSTRLLDVDFIQAIIPHSERWEHIDFKLPIESLRLIGADFPLLRSLTLGPSRYARETGSLDAISLFSNAPLLKQVALSNHFGPFEIQLPWSQLTSVSAQCLSSAECIEILQHSAALQEFRCDNLQGDASGNILPVAPLRHLHSLKFGGGSGHQRLLEVFTTPTLQHLTILDSQFDAIPHINALILRLNCTLASLCILSTYQAEATYHAAFPSIPTITTETRSIVGSDIIPLVQLTFLRILSWSWCQKHHCMECNQ